MNSLYSSIHSHLWAKAKRGRIECISALEKQVAGGSTMFLIFKFVPLSCKCIVIYYIYSLVRHTVDLITTF